MIIQTRLCQINSGRFFLKKCVVCKSCWQILFSSEVTINMQPNRAQTPLRLYLKTVTDCVKAFCASSPHTRWTCSSSLQLDGDSESEEVKSQYLLHFYSRSIMCQHMYLWPFYWHKVGLMFDIRIFRDIYLM